MELIDPQVVLWDILVIFAASSLVLLLSIRLKMPPIVGFLITGILIGPSCLGLISESREAKRLADIGMVLLLFTVGMEFSLKKIIQYRKYFFVGGGLQVICTIAAGFVIGVLLGRPVGEAVFLGFLLSLSSTAIVLRILEERGETASPHAKPMLGMLIFQDLAVIPMVVLTPLLGAIAVLPEADLLRTLFFDVIAILFLLIVGYTIVPKILHAVAKTRSRELFLISILLICFGITYGFWHAGISLSLGAFFAGIVIAESEYRHEAIGSVIPFQDVFISLYFVLIGMLLDVQFLMQHPLLILTATVGVLIVKTLIATAVALGVGVPLRTAVITGLAVSQIGEFTFVLIQEGASSGISTPFHYQLFFAVSLLTMALTPFLFLLAFSLDDAIEKIPMPDWLRKELKIHETEKEGLQGHIVIVGMGLAGKNLSYAARESSIPYIVLETNPDIVQKEKESGEPVHYGDATNETVLMHAGIKKAKCIAIVVNDPTATIRIVKHARRLNPSIYIIVRASYVHEVSHIYTLGADDVIPDELGSSLEIFGKVLKQFDVDECAIEKCLGNVRYEGYEIMRMIYSRTGIFSHIPTVLIKTMTEVVSVGKRSAAAGKTIKEAALRNLLGVTLLLISREGKIIPNPEPEEILFPEDLVVILGSKANLRKAILFFKSEMQGERET